MEYYILYRMREAEIVHGRMAMLAIAGELLAEIHHPVFPTASGTALEQFQAVGKLCGPVSCTHYRISNP